MAGAKVLLIDDDDVTKPLDFAKLLSLLERVGCDPQHVSTPG